MSSTSTTTTAGCKSALEDFPDPKKYKLAYDHESHQYYIHIPSKGKIFPACNAKKAVAGFLCTLPKFHTGSHNALDYLTSASLRIWKDNNVEPAVDTTAPPICYLCKVPLCSVCGTCEEDLCRLNGKAVKTAAGMAPFKFLLAVSQKIRGYTALATAGLAVPTPYRVITLREEIAAAIQEYIALPYAIPLFARPCPVRPRHGFVESRVVAGDYTVEVTKLFDQALAADPKAEMLICPAIKATHNLIITPTRMAVGKGNDGATGGVESLTIPLVGVPFSELSPTVLKQAGLDVTKEDPYIEVVIEGGATGAYGIYGTPKEVKFTQLRAGVKLDPIIGADFIPSEVVVTSVVKAAGDLLEWEKQTQALTAGTVVVHIGGSLISHYGVHCMQNNIPCLTSREPNIGETLVPTPRLTKPDPQAVLEGLAVGTLIRLDTGHHPQQGLTVSQASLIIVTVMHNSAAMSGADGYWLGLAVALMMRLGMTASHGEARHADPARRGLSRDAIYKLALNDFFNCRGLLGRTQYLFRTYAWQSGFGGKKWAECTESVFRMDEAARALIADPTEGTVAALILALNQAVNQAHNGGWWLNKFVMAQAFTDASVQSIKSLSVAAPAMLTAKGCSTDSAAEILNKWKDAGAILVPVIVPKVQEAKSETVSQGVINGTAISTPFPGCGDPACEDCTTLAAKGKVKQEIGDLLKKMDDAAAVKLSKPPYTMGTQTSSTAQAGAALPKEAVQGSKLSIHSSNFGLGKPKPKAKKSAKLPEYIGNKLNNSGWKSTGPIEVLKAHGRFGKSEHGCHVQFVLKGAKGYYSFTVDSPPLVGAEWDKYHDDVSYSGATTLYAKLSMTLISGTLYRFTHTELDRTFDHDIAHLL